MNRMLVRLVASHVLVALVAVGLTFLLVRSLAPRLFDQTLGAGAGGRGAAGLLRLQMAESVDRALLIGGFAGLSVGVLLGVVAAQRLSKPLTEISRATRQLAEGGYHVDIAPLSVLEYREVAEDLSRLGRRLDDVEARRVRLLGELAHELRTPLTVIAAQVEAMIDQVVQPSPENLSVVAGEARRMTRLANDLSTLSRTEEGRVSLRVAKGDLAEVAALVCDRLASQSVDTGIDLVCDTEPLVAEFDRDQLTQVVTNLVGNALSACGRGDTITITGHSDRQWVTLVVRDTGVGIADGELDHIFERFHRIEPHRYGGSGVGLTIARRIVEDHSGTLTATSPGPGRGAAFEITLPRVRSTR